MNIEQILSSVNTIVILGHVHPDGDCVGSTIGLYNYIRDNYPEKCVTVYLEDFNKDFLFLRGAKDINHSLSDDKEIDLCICLDAADQKRLGDYVVYFEKAKKTICIDHHISNEGYCDENYIVPSSSSTSETICDLINHEKISKYAAEAFYMGIVHDTGVFKHNNTKRNTMALAGEFIEKGVDSSFIIDETFYKKTFAQNKLMGKALLNAELYENGQIIATHITNDDMQEVGATAKDTDGIVDQLRITEGVAVAVFAYDNPDGTVKFSMRVNGNVNVSDIAVFFGGGGHIKAAGFTATDEYEKVLMMVISKINEQMK